MDIPNAYFRFIIGKGGDMKRRLEAETQTTIYVPRFQEKGPIGTVPKTVGPIFHEFLN